MNKSRIKFGALLVVMLIVSMAFVPAVSAQAVSTAPAETENKSASCGGCAENGGCKSTFGDPKKINGSEKDKWVDKALKDNSFKEIKKQLKKDGFIQQHSQAFTILAENEDGSKTDILYVTTSFRIDGSEEGKTVLFVHNAQTGESISMLVDGDMTIQGLGSCQLYLAACLLIASLCIIPCAAVFVPPVAPGAALTCLGCIVAIDGVCKTANNVCSQYMCDEGFETFCD